MKDKKPQQKRSPLKGSESIIGAANSIICAALSSPDSLAEVELLSEYFPLAWQQEVWIAIQFLYDSKSKLDVVLLSEQLDMMDRESPEGSWLSFLGTHMRDNSGSSSNITHYADALVKWQRRSRCSEIGSALVVKANDGEDGSDDAIRDLMAMSASTRILDGPLAESIHEAVDILDARAQAKVKVHGVPYGITGMDKLLSGMEKSHLIILAGRPSMGKTAAALCICANNAMVPCGFISTEQPRREMINRLVSIHGGVDGHHMRTGQLTEEEWVKATAAYADISKWPLYMNDRPGPDLSEVVRQARKWKHRYDIQYLVVDYLQRIRVKDSSKRHEEVGEVASTLKNLARELEIPVMALSQINRGVESRPNKRPVLSDLRESGDIEQEADIIITMYRDEVYHDDESKRGHVEFGIPKNRHGPTGKVECHYEGRFLRFEDFAIEQQGLDLPPPSSRNFSEPYRSDG